jgi:hypothetical protein
VHVFQLLDYLVAQPLHFAVVRRKLQRTQELCKSKNSEIQCYKAWLKPPSRQLLQQYDFCAVEYLKSCSSANLGKTQILPDDV